MIRGKKKKEKEREETKIKDRKQKIIELLVGQRILMINNELKRSYDVSYKYEVHFENSDSSLTKRM